ncbi:hypothetical protein CDAR_594861 [Caerostris darwini]|uniref:Uncharacterized protein n=1 Tax=Caerostris darwini TaxID=1538125 RepID=A0AAV4P787_9ARAC|nr:hypothetical protein CDAR_594861 [Caerostris darwini]
MERVTCISPAKARCYPSAPADGSAVAKEGCPGPHPNDIDPATPPLAKLGSGTPLYSRPKNKRSPVTGSRLSNAFHLHLRIILGISYSVKYSYRMLTVTGKEDSSRSFEMLKDIEWTIKHAVCKQVHTSPIKANGCQRSMDAMC